MLACDLEADPFVSHALTTTACELYYRCGQPLSIVNLEIRKNLIIMMEKEVQIQQVTTKPEDNDKTSHTHK